MLCICTIYSATQMSIWAYLRCITHGSFLLSYGISIVVMCSYCIIFFFFRRAALRTWRQRHGSSATYNNLIKVFKQASYNDLALSIKTNVPTDADNSSGNLNHTPPPSAQFSSSQIFSSPQFAAISTVVPLKEDQRGNIILVCIVVHHSDFVMHDTDVSSPPSL